MSELLVVIDRASKTAVFSGPGTFLAKENIKSLGKYRFDAINKSWIISSFSLSKEDLEKKFPNIIIDEVNTSATALSLEEENSLIKEDKPDGAVSVSEFIQRVQLALKSVFPYSFCIYGVLTEVKHSQDRVFMELAEQEQRDTRVKCIIWSSAEKITASLIESGFKLEPDLPVMFEVSASLNAKGAQLSLTVKKIIVEYTKSKLASLRDQTNERLKKEGIFQKNKERKLAFLPRNLGILTSSGGTVINDFMASLSEAKFGFNLFWLNVNVQGSEAKSSVLKGIELLSSYPGLDAILIFRGGGSQAELSVFNDYDIAKAVCLSPLPVVSAIGHQADQCSVQDVSYKSCGVPKEIGWYFASIVIDYKDKFSLALKSIANYSSLVMKNYDQRFFDIVKPLVALAKKAASEQASYFKSILERLPLQIQKIFNFQETMLASLGAKAIFSAEKIIINSKNKLERSALISREVKFLLEQKESRVVSLEELVQGASPQVQLKRGFSLIKKEDNKTFIKSASELKKGDLVNIEFSDNIKIAEIK